MLGAHAPPHTADTLTRTHTKNEKSCRKKTQTRKLATHLPRHTPRSLSIVRLFDSLPFYFVLLFGSAITSPSPYPYESASRASAGERLTNSSRALKNKINAMIIAKAFQKLAFCSWIQRTNRCHEPRVFIFPCCGWPRRSDQASYCYNDMNKQICLCITNFCKLSLARLDTTEKNRAADLPFVYMRLRTCQYGVF